MARFQILSDLPQATQDEIARVSAIASAQRTSVESAFLTSRADYLYNEILSENAAGDITRAAGRTLPVGLSGFAVNAEFNLLDANGAYFTVARNIGSTTEAAWFTETFAEGAPADDVNATLSTNLAGSNNDIVFTAVAPGVSGNLISIEYLDPEDTDVALSVGVVGNAITVTLATDESGVITSTADLIKTAIEAEAEADALVTVADKAANDGSGVVIAMAATLLTGGAPDFGVTGSVGGSRYTDTATGTLYINTGDAEDPTWTALAEAA